MPKSLQPFAKAIAPAVLSLVGALVNSLADGKFDSSSIKVLVGGLVLSAVAYLVPNAKQPAK